MSEPSEYALFKIGTTDFTKNICTDPPYAVNSKEIYEEYGDGNHKFRRRLIRKRISGTFSMMFSSPTEYDNFVTTLEGAKGNDTSITCSVFVRNTKSVTTDKFYIDYEPPLIDPVIGTKKVAPLEIAISQQ